MDSLPPDPYSALGLAKDAPSGTIKSTYRKLVLKCHPDKVQDESLKQEAADRFHKIQSAYEIIGDEDRRARYDAQVKLAELRKDVYDRSGGSGRGGVDVRTAAYKMPTESRGGDFYARGPDRYTRVSPQYEERRPSYAPEDYFDLPRANSRKYDEYERSAKRASPKEDKPKAKVSSRETKESERSTRKEKSRRTEKDVRRDRERKTTYATVEDDDSEYDSAERRRRVCEDEDVLRRREADARNNYFDITREQKEAAESGAYRGTRADKLLAQEHALRERISADRERGPASSERRPEAPRYSSSKDKVNLLRGEAGKPVLSRSRSDRPKVFREDTGKSSRAKDRESEYAEEIREPRRSSTREAKAMPTLKSTKSAPPESIRPSFDRQRSYSVQEDPTEVAPPQIRRSETMPLSPPPVGRDSRPRREGSKLRPAEAYITPERTPEPGARTSKQRFGNHAYADDNEIPTPNGYQTEVREPPITERYVDRSPERYEDRPRAASARQATAAQPPPLPRTTSRQYVYPDTTQQAYTRPSAPSRESSGRFYGEIPTTKGSPKPAHGRWSPPSESVKYAPPYEIKVAAGRGSEKPGYFSRERDGSSRRAVHA